MGKHNVKFHEAWFPGWFAGDEYHAALSRLQRRKRARRLAMARTTAGAMIVPSLIMASVIAAKPAATTYQEIRFTSSDTPVVTSARLAPKKAGMSAAVALPIRGTTDRGHISRTLPSQPPKIPAASSASAAKWIAVLDAYLAGSPMAGMGKVFYEAAAANGLDPRLSVGIAKVESGLGRAIPGGFNAYGMTAGTAPGHGRIGSWQAFASWEDAIWSNNTFIRRKWGPGVGPYQMRGYATSPTWAPRVSAVMSSIPSP